MQMDAFEQMRCVLEDSVHSMVLQSAPTLSILIASTKNSAASYRLHTGGLYELANELSQQNKSTEQLIGT
jgi:hypothetical protein